jgi:hypothetical protein
LPHHTFLQYTATPQAPLLLNIIDSLSPRFAEILSPGPEYVGGKDFFLNPDSLLVREIPDDELPGEEPAEEVPESLLDAMRLFFIGAAAGCIRVAGKGNRSMMVHPSQQRTGHNEYFSWVAAVRKEWTTLLSSGDQYADDRAELLADFEEAYADIAQTAGSDLPPKEEVFKTLPWIVANTLVLEVNAKAGETPKVNWSSNFSHILVGGQAMDRGFTVEGLTVTYMPRGLGVGNADTVQQRARFFGYKRRYLGYCRVFLERTAIQAYRLYVRHELIAHREAGKPLTAWKRAFYLDKSLKPTRSSVLELDHVRTATLIKEWFTPDKPHEGNGQSDDPVAENREVVAALRESLEASWREDEGSSERTKYQRHLVARVKLGRVFEECLLQLRFTDLADSHAWTVVQILLAELLDRCPEQECVVYIMSGGLPRERTVDEEGNIKNLYQGAAPTKPASEIGRIYPGDRKMVAADVPTIQIHSLDVLPASLEGAHRARVEPLAQEVPTVAIHFPAGTVEDLLIQPQPEQQDSDV